MGRPKLSFDVDADKIIAICDYIRNHAADISFLRFPKGMKVTKVKITNLEKNDEEPNSMHVLGYLRGNFPNGDGISSEIWRFSCYCRVKRGTDDEPVVYELDQLGNDGRLC